MISKALEHADWDVPTDSRLVILMPVFNDWQAAGRLIVQLDKALAEPGIEADVLVVDDASCQPAPLGFPPIQLKALRRIMILPLRRNLGHQRAIAIGLAYVQKNFPNRDVLVMDADGEDQPTDVPRLIEALHRRNRRQIVFAQRVRRSEGPFFRFCYWCYKWSHRLLTGCWQDFGNFSVIPSPLLDRVVVVSEIWNHYAAGVVMARLPYDTIPTRRGNRLSGRSKMNFVSLLIHGMSAMSVYAPIVGVRLLVACGAAAALMVVAACAVVGIRLFTDLAIAGWATAAFGLTAVLLFQTLGMAGAAVFLMLHNQNRMGFLPARDFHLFTQPLRVFAMEGLESRWKTGADGPGMGKDYAVEPGSLCTVHAAAAAEAATG